MGNNIKSNTTFWTEINNYKIQVPYYQRDYAQGRTDGGRIDNIRKVFVEELYQAINGERLCHLGLVFGSYDNNNSTFIAVDGQQRLTTVFLLHWYAAWRENKLNDYKELLTNFSWDTRSYSSQFVELLFNINQTENIINAITSNCNYFSIWENDPTVKGMLTMLKEIESQYPKEGGLCQKLFSNDCNIRYDILKLEKNSDAKTYLKMNSRGRSLTTFELFKSKFIDEYKPSFANQFDNKWLNFILKRSNDDKGIFADPDIFFMNFINEFTYMILSLYSNDDSDKGYKHFIDAKMKGNLTDVPFISFEKYKTAFDKTDVINRFGKFFDWICANYEIIEIIDGELRFPDSNFFANEIIKSSNPHFSHRTKLFSLFKYAELTKYVDINNELYKRWNRVLRNLVINTDIDGNNFGRICKTINQIDDYDIYLYLTKDGILNTFDKDQVAEEIAKAEQIVTSGDEWETKIIAAEKYAFFKGAIRFLFTKESIGDDWEHFDTKWKKTQEYFKEKPKPKQSALNKEFDNAALLKALISRFSTQNYWDVLNWHYRVFNNYDVTWRYYLLNDRIFSPIHEIMMGNTCIKELNPSQDEAENRLYQLSQTKLLDFVIKTIPESWIRNYHGHKAIFPSGKGVFLNADIRDSLLTAEEIKLKDEEDKVPETNFLYGSNIYFQYNQQCFIYYSNNTVCLMKENWNGKKLKNSKDKDEPENNFYFVVDDEENIDSFLEKLDCLIAQAGTNDSEKRDLQNLS